MLFCSAGGWLPTRPGASCVSSSRWPNRRMSLVGRKAGFGWQRKELLQLPLSPVLLQKCCRQRWLPAQPGPWCSLPSVLEGAG